MGFSAYKINPKHRAKKPTPNASIWTVPEWTEIQLFGEASRKNWRSPSKNFIWAISSTDACLLKIGIDTTCELYIAKFRCDHNLEWHGYPVLPRGDDIPPDSVLELWRQEELIDKTCKRRIQSGKFSS